MVVAGTKVIAAEMVNVVRFWIHLEGRANSICLWIGWLQGVGSWRSLRCERLGNSRRALWDILSLTCLSSIRMELLYHFLSSFKHMLICVSFLSCWTTQSFPKWLCPFMYPGLCIGCSLCGESCHPSFSSESLFWSFTNALTCHSVFMFLSSLQDFKICTPFTLISPAPDTRCSEYLARKQLDGWVSGLDGEVNRWALSTVRPNRVLMVMMGIPLEHRQVRWSPQTEMKETADVRKFLC